VKRGCFQSTTDGDEESHSECEGRELRVDGHVQQSEEELLGHAAQITNGARVRRAKRDVLGATKVIADRMWMAATKAARRKETNNKARQGKARRERKGDKERLRWPEEGEKGRRWREEREGGRTQVGDGDGRTESVRRRVEEKGKDVQRASEKKGGRKGFSPREPGWCGALSRADFGLQSFIHSFSQIISCSRILCLQAMIYVVATFRLFLFLSCGKQRVVPNR
jgi:hypothetical protein